MRKSIHVPPPDNFSSFSPSELFRFYFQIGRWTEDSFSDDLQVFTRGKLVSTVTISKWKNKNVIPTRYSGAFLSMIRSFSEPALAKEWMTAFETVWALQSAGRKQHKPQISASTFSDAVCRQHREWIAQLYLAKRPNSGFSPADIYVPLQLTNISTDDPAPQNVQDITDLVNEAGDGPSAARWIFISGGPGAGKSTTALHLAHSFCEGNVCPIYLRGSRLSNIHIDVIDPTQPIGDSFSAKSFLQNFRASSFKVACVILDGLDEINRGPQGSKNALHQFIAELKHEQTACAVHNKQLWVIALGREAHIQVSTNLIAEAGVRRFALRGLDGSTRSQSNPLNSVQGEDLRALWWDKFLAASDNESDPSLPHFLTTDYDDFAEFGTDPLLTFLICHAALENPDNRPAKTLPHERVNALTYATNKNEIYKAMVDRQARSVRHLLNTKRFLSVLQHMALAMWQTEDGRHASLKSVYDCVQDEETRTSFQVLGLFDSSAQTPPNMLITIFYYRLSQDNQKLQEAAVEFPHKSFGKYLVSTVLFDRFTALISAFSETAKFEDALSDWILVSKQGTHSPSLADFCQKEAAIRFDLLSGLDWDAALMIIRNHLHRANFDNTGISFMSEILHSGSTLMFIWSCLNLERQKRTGKHFPLPNNDLQFDVSDLKAIQRPNGLNFESGSLIEPTLRDLTFLSQTISALHLKSADMSQLSFSFGHIENLNCEDTSFAMTHWSHVKLTAASFARSLFQQAIFHHWRATDSCFTTCLFQGARFQGGNFTGCHIEETVFSQCHFSDVEFISSQFTNVVFDRCVFLECDFLQGKKTDRSLDAQFRHCTFMNMDTSLRNIPVENISSSITEFESEKAESQTGSPAIRVVLDDLL